MSNCTILLLMYNVSFQRLAHKAVNPNPPSPPTATVPHSPSIEEFDVIENELLSEEELLAYLSPDPLLLEQQTVAENLFQVSFARDTLRIWICRADS